MESKPAAHKTSGFSETERTSFARREAITGGFRFRYEPQRFLNLRPALLDRDRFAGNFPRPLRTIYRRFVVVLKPVVMVGVAHRAQRLVVKAGQPQRDFQLFGKRLQ